MGIRIEISLQIEKKKTSELEVYLIGSGDAGLVRDYAKLC